MPVATKAAEARGHLTSADVRRGLRAEEFFVAYQPQVDLRSGSVRGAEALVRWRHPRLGALSPREFLPAAEQSGAIALIDDYVLARACTDAGRWREAGFPELRVAVNLSVRSLEDPRLIDRIRKLCIQSGLGARWLEVEVTESAAVRHDDRVGDALTRLRNAGVLVALDDFGTGYSMLERLRELPFDALKIDRSFVHGLSAASGPQLLLAAIELGHALGLRVVAEGVEDQAQLGFLRRHGCDEAQGYLLGRPTPADDVLPLLGAPARALAPRHARIEEPFASNSQALERLVRPLLTELARLTELESTYLTYIDRKVGRQFIVYARNVGDLDVAEGIAIPWEDTVCKRSLESGVRCTSDVASAFGDSPAGRDLGLRTYAGVPVLDEYGSVWGTLCGASLHERSVGEPALAVMEAFARLVARQLQLIDWESPTARV